MNLVIWRNIIPAAAVIIVATAIGFSLNNQKRGITYSGSVNLTVHVQEAQATAGQTVIDVQQSGDATQATATVQNWMADPSFVSGVYAKAGADISTLSLGDQAKKFKTVITNPVSTSFQVQASDGEQSHITSIFTALKTNLDERVGQYNAASLTGKKLAIEQSNAVVTSTAEGVPITPLAAFLSGCILAALLVAVLERQRKG
jgi:hypothetical protein